MSEAWTQEKKDEAKTEIVETLGRICVGFLDCSECHFGYCRAHGGCAREVYTMGSLTNKKLHLKSLLKNVRAKEKHKNGIFAEPSVPKNPIPAKLKQIFGEEIFFDEIIGRENTEEILNCSTVEEAVRLLGWANLAVDSVDQPPISERKRFRRIVPKEPWTIAKTCERAGCVLEEMAQLHHDNSKLDSEIRRINGIKANLLLKIGNKQRYINQLQNQIKETLSIALGAERSVATESDQGSGAGNQK